MLIYANVATAINIVVVTFVIILVVSVLMLAFLWSIVRSFHK